MNMKRVTCVVVAVLAWAVSSTAGAAGLAWAVHGENGGTVYLVGTVHAANEAFYPLPEAIDAAFEQAEVLVMEVDPALLDGQAMAAVVAQLGLLPPGERLQDMMSAEHWTAASQYAAASGVQPEVLDRFRPWFAATIVSVSRIDDAGYNPDLGMEQYFHRRADRGMPLIALVTPEEQMQMLAGLSLAAQLAFLESSLVDGFADEVGGILDAWRAGDHEALASLGMETYEESAEVYERLIVARNRAWIPPIEAMVADGRTHFVAVGSLHLVGPDGVVAMLRARGYRVEMLDQTSIISKSSLPASQSGQRQLSGMSSHAVPGAMPVSGWPSDSR
jgi:uncharacterized protein YbaP (TraB family)